MALNTTRAGEAMAERRWDDAFLDQMRQVGDPPADEAVRALFESGDRAAVARLLDSLTRNDAIVPESLPDPIRRYFDSVPQVPAPEQPVVVEGQRLFADYGPEIMMILACYSLPASYAARNGVQVLHRTGFLQDRATRRLFQTAQMVIDVMVPKGLEPKGRGRATAEKVRLMHAAIRRLLLTDETTPWDPAFGVPINQEDLAGTLMTFTSVILDGLKKLDIEVSLPRADAYLTAWQSVGRMMGVVDELIPRTVDDAFELMQTIERRQVAPSPEGRDLALAALQMMEAHTPPGLKNMPSALMRHFLPPEVADGLGVPSHRLEEKLVSASVFFGHLSDVLTGGVARRRVFRMMGLYMIQLFLMAELGGRRPTFRVPEDLQQQWDLSSAG